MRLGIFSKDTIDLYDLSNCVTLQTVGRRVVFYSTFLVADGIYAMIEVGAVNCPFSLKHLSDYFNKFDDLLMVLLAMGSYKKLESETPPEYQRQNFDSPTLISYFGKKKDSLSSNGTFTF